MIVAMTVGVDCTRCGTPLTRSRTCTQSPGQRAKLQELKSANERKRDLARRHCNGRDAPTSLQDAFGEDNRMSSLEPFLSEELEKYV